jgi:uncharacterized protein YndB with AHSA1/START domain
VRSLHTNTINYGTIAADSATVRLERVFLIPVEQLWAYLTTPEGLRRWIAEGQIGPGRARLEFLDNGTVTEGPVLAWDPPNLVEFEWTGGPTQPAGSRVRFELTAEGEGTRLVLTHSRTSAPAAPDFAAGWHYHLDTLSFLVTGAEPPAGRPTWRQLRGHYLPTAQLPGTPSSAPG